MAEFVARVDREIAINSEFRQGFEALDPPDPIADVHRIIDDILDRGLSAAEGLVAVADTVSSLEEAEQTPEFLLSTRRPTQIVTASASTWKRSSAISQPGVMWSSTLPGFPICA